MHSFFVIKIITKSFLLMLHVLVNYYSGNKSFDFMDTLFYIFPIQHM